MNILMYSTFNKGRLKKLFHYIFNYPKDKVSVRNHSFFILPEKSGINTYHFFDLNICSINGLPIKKALIYIFKSDRINEYDIIIDSKGYYPVKLNNVKLYPGIISELYANMVSVKTKTISNLKYNNSPYFLAANEMPQNQDEIREMTLTLGMDSPKDTVTYLYAEKFAEEVNSLSNGKMKIDVYTDAALGSDRQMLRSIIEEGRPDFIVQNTAPQVTFIPKVSIFDIPMLYNDIQKLRNAIDNERFIEKINNIYSEKGYKLLGLSDQLFRQLTSNKKIRNIGNLNEIKMRTIQNPNHIKFWNLLGTTVIPLPVSEIYLSLKQGFLDAQENGYEQIYGMKLYEVQDHVTNTNHLPNLFTLITSEDIFSTFTEAEKAIIEEAADTATIYAREKADERIGNIKQFLIDNGMTILDIPEKTRQDIIKNAAIPVYEDIREIVNDDELINTYVELSK